MSRQPLNLSSLLTFSARGRGTIGQVTSTGHPPPPSRRNRGGSARATLSPPGFDSTQEAGDAHCDKCPRNEDAGDAAAQAVASIQQPPSPNTQVLHQTWAPQLIRGDWPINVGDNASSSETVLALVQGLLLPVDMQKESGSLPDRLVSTGLISGIKVTFPFVWSKYHFSSVSFDPNFFHHTWYLSVYPEDGGARPKTAGDRA